MLLRYRICVCDASASIIKSQDGSTNITTGVVGGNDQKP